MLNRLIQKVVGVVVKGNSTENGTPNIEMEEPEL